jgi:hypothetical protein
VAFFGRWQGGASAQRTPPFQPGAGLDYGLTERRNLILAYWVEEISGCSACVESCNVTLADHNTYGQVMSGKIVISGFCQSVVSLGRQSKRYFARNDDDGFWRFPDPFCKSRDFPYTLEHIIVDIDDFSS